MATSAKAPVNSHPATINSFPIGVWYTVGIVR
jgi:hypothetical protein